METETFLTLAIRLGYITSTDAKSGLALITEISKMITSLRTKMKSRAQGTREKLAP